jgi:aminoglycoside phosphotransferase (APT) family kinase protein
MELVTQIQNYLQDKLSSALKVQNFCSLSGGGGACQDNYSFDLFVETGEYQGMHSLVLRTDKGASLYASLPKKFEFQVCSMAYQAGVKTPKPYWLEPDTGYTGNPFYIMQRIGGKANGRYIVKDICLNAVRKTFSEVLAQNLSAIHSITPQTTDDTELRAVLDRAGLDLNSYSVNVISELRNELSKLPEAHPAIELVLNWAEKRNFVPDKLVLVHGDFRTGNFMVSPSGLEGIIDWEFAHWGDRHEDISWLCLRDWRFGKQNKEVGGFGSREEFYRAYQKHSGLEVDPQKVLYWEVIGNARWAIGAAGQAERHLSGKDKGIELASIGRRVCEMEFEAMRLVENAR